ncbi:MAG TPA: amino acid adenylation domain-containing protein [Pyrinomonadaceae bacterium]|jgi:amino acid adenylation domain-containing protein
MTGISQIYPLSPIQQGILFHSLYSPESEVYVVQLSCILDPAPDVDAFTRAWNELVRRHGIFRTAFEWEELDDAVQVVYDEAEVSLERLDWRGLSRDEQHESLRAYLKAERARGFDYSAPPLMRLALISLDETTARLVWTVHHLLVDTWSETLLFAEASARYHAILEGRPLPEEPAPSYLDYVKWLQQQDMSEADGYWRGQLGDFTEPTPLGARTAFVSQTAPGEIYETRQQTLDAGVTRSLQAFARRHGLTLNTLTQCAWALLLSRYSGQEDVVFGLTVTGRPVTLPGAESIIGPFLNTLPLRVRLPRDETVLPLLNRLQEQATDLRHYEYSPLVRVQGLSGLQGGVPLFESIYVFHSAPVGLASLERERDGRLMIRDVQTAQHSNYPLSLIVTPGEELTLRLTYDASAFDPRVITQMLEHIGNLLLGMVADPAARAFDLALLSPDEQRRLVVEWNDTAADLPPYLCLHECIEARAAEAPESTAVVMAGERLTYGELNRRANQLAHFLTAQGVGPEVRVALLLERSPEMVVALLAVLKAGGAYLPLNLGASAKRLESTVADSEAPVVLTQERLRHLLPPTPEYGVWSLDADWPLLSAGSDGEADPPPRAMPENLVYVIYTSGSTGTPKGVMVTHRSLMNHLGWAVKKFGLSARSRSIVHTEVCFDLTVTSLLPPLVAGAAVELVRPGDNVGGLWAALSNPEHEYSLIKLTPSHLQLLNHWLEQQRVCGRVEVAVIGGEALAGEALRLWRELFPQIRLFNEYGPTEATVAATIYEVPASADPSGPMPIGRPLDNMRLYVLDAAMRLVPAGVTGEVYIGGEGVARGYLGRPALTAEKFVPDPFGSVPGARLYRSGDVGRMRADGELEYLCRTDHQVKVRGFRIELGEVESVLRQCPAVQKCAVIVREIGGEKALVGYLVLEDGVDGDEVPKAVRAHLGERLPDYMSPAAFVILPELPLNANGKIDRSALQALEGDWLKAQEEFAAPSTPVEDVLAGIWAEVFEVASVGARDNFFQLGGHSLLGMRVISKVREVFKIDLPLRTLFACPVLADLARELETAMSQDGGLSAVPIRPAPRGPAAPLSFAQQRLWITQQLDPETTAYNVSQAVRLRGPLKIDALEAALTELVRRHEILRTTFPVSGGEPVQSIAPARDFKLAVEDLSAAPPREAEAQAGRVAREEAEAVFDLERGPLLRFRLLRLGEDDHVLVTSRHHIIFDGWSQEIFTRELVALYNAFAAGRPSPLAEPPIQYADFACWQREWLAGEKIEKLLRYWGRRLEGAPSSLNLPTDAVAAGPSEQATWVTFVLDKERCEAIRALSRANRVSVYTTLLAAFKTLLYRYSGQTDFLVGTPVTSRNRAEIEPLIGCFLNMLILRTDLAGNPTFRELLGRARETVLGAYTHQEMPFEKLVEELKLGRGQRNAPFPQVVFSHVRHPGKVPGLAGLSATPLNVETEAAKFDWLMLMVERDEEIVASLQYRSRMFDDETMGLVARHFENLFRSILANPDARLDELEMLSREEQALLSAEIDVGSISRSFSF